MTDQEIVHGSSQTATYHKSDIMVTVVVVCVCGGGGWGVGGGGDRTVSQRPVPEYSSEFMQKREFVRSLWQVCGSTGKSFKKFVVECDEK